MEIYFKYIEAFYLLALLPILVIFSHLIKKRRRVVVASTDLFSSKQRTYKYYLRFLPDFFAYMSLIFIIIAIAAPHQKNVEEIITYDGIDIVIAMDISGSMLANDFSPNRLETAKQKASRFIAERQGDRIGLVLYAGEAYTLAPLTGSKSFLLEQVNQIKTGKITDGTAIGVGLAVAVTALSDTLSERVIILLSDGVNNTGNIAPLTAAQIAGSRNIKVYTIGIGKQGKAMVPENADGSGQLIEADVSPDNETLMEIARITGGKFFLAEDENSLSQIYDEINILEKTHHEIETIEHINELYHWAVIIAIILLIIEFLLKTLFIRVFP